MPVSECHCCGGEYRWKWEEAFEKFGFGDGDGQIETGTVEAVLTAAGYEVESDTWGIHNVVIRSIRKDGRDLMPVDDSKFVVGYDDPGPTCPRKSSKCSTANYPKLPINQPKETGFASPFPSFHRGSADPPPSRRHALR